LALVEIRVVFEAEVAEIVRVEACSLIAPERTSSKQRREYGDQRLRVGLLRVSRKLLTRYLNIASEKDPL
jgi:hypothetical protein